MSFLSFGKVPKSQKKYVPDSDVPDYGRKKKNELFGRFWDSGKSVSV
jgi:hypothetical protein